MTVDTSVSGIAWEVKRLLADILDVDPGTISDDAPLFDTDYAPDSATLDSLDGIKFGLALADEFGLDVNIDLDYSELSTVRAIATYVHELLTREVLS